MSEVTYCLKYVWNYTFSHVLLLNTKSISYCTDITFFYAEDKVCSKCNWNIYLMSDFWSVMYFIFLWKLLLLPHSACVAFLSPKDIFILLFLLLKYVYFCIMYLKCLYVIYTTNFFSPFFHQFSPQSLQSGFTLLLSFIREKATVTRKLAY